MITTATDLDRDGDHHQPSVVFTTLVIVTAVDNVVIIDRFTLVVISYQFITMFILSN